MLIKHQTQRENSLTTLDWKTLIQFLYWESIYIVYYFYICSFSFLNAPAKYTYCSIPENKTVYFICILCVFVMCIFVLIQDKIMTKIFIFTHFGLNICHTFLYFVTLKGFVFIIGKLVWLYCSNSLHNRKTNMTKNRDKIVNRDTPSRGDVPPLVRDCALVTPFHPCPSGGLCTPLLSNTLQNPQKLTMVSVITRELIMLFTLEYWSKY